ncbi:type III-B CRISPR-associated protein Cas10/Cmr2 [Anaerobranca gottschalkii]|uniref:CRISPR-associated protein Cmr2 n=1 Tax=Anaerobranca gottschalkii DSM 13577 TaxID=1120990 RepID=A0A1I0C1Z2_9FIRM|nr:type III-B CRISPR-associated protein Cas10/Cmr2 [Anaerobranca gottschalkii]SET12893.1 CRISPR-associated protein Cmr2 [Anaerobranca gottschalkii DSM 13577]
MVKTLVIFSIGPVQSFINKARKTSDLYAGSKLLSDLIEKAMQAFKNQQGLKVEIVYPSEALASKPNRFLAVVETEGLSKGLNAVCKEIEKMLYQEVETIFCSLLQKLKLKEPAGFKRQLERFLEVHWAIFSLDDKNYQEGFNQIDKLMGAVKNTRTFKQLQEGHAGQVLGETGRKCSLCGEFNVLFYRSKDNKIDYINPKTNLKSKYISPAAINLNNICNKNIFTALFSENEGLCAVCFIKRFYRYDTQINAFSSTSEIALMETLERVKQDGEIKKQITEYENLFKSKNNGLFESSLFYKENLTEDYFKKWGYPLEVLGVSQDLLNNIHKKAAEKGLNFSKYYAVLSLDGDDMGQWLSGENLIDQGGLFEFHKKLANSLGEYAQKICDALKPPKGQLVYAGGDDVLGFVNLNHLVDVLTEIRRDFPALEQLAKTPSHKKSSASVGVAIAHYKTPLSEVLSISRHMLEKAKENHRKNSLAIALIKRSGETVEAVYEFEQQINSSSYIVLRTIQRIIDEISKGSFSKGFIKNLRAEFMRLLGCENDNFIEENILIEEINRLVARSCMMLRKPGESEEDYKNRKAESISCFQNDLIDLLNTGLSGGTNIIDYFNLLDIAVFLGKEVNHDS